MTPENKRDELCQLLRTLRGCEAGEYPCPFCRWTLDQDTNGKADSESGCEAWADEILKVLA